jgi:threonine aldolase
MAIDLRSDTVTRPTPAMLEAMMAAPLGDDVIGDDPTVKRLEDRCASLLGMDAACFVPTATMANQLAIRSWCEHGDEIIAHAESHIIYYETGAPAALSGCMIRPLQGPRGRVSPDDVRRAVRGGDQHEAITRLLVIENTHNRGGGAIWPLAAFRDVADAAHERNLKVHLDGARLFNACVAAKIKPSDYGRCVDSASICFSKGLGAPVGSVLVGPKPFIARARRFRKMFGGSMRQSGILAAAALFALDHNVDRLADDHANAQRLARGWASIPLLKVDASLVETNMIFVEVDPSLGSAADLSNRLAEESVLTFDMDPTRLRAVTHLDVTTAMIDEAIERTRRVVERMRSAILEGSVA